MRNPSTPARLLSLHNGVLRIGDPCAMPCCVVERCARCAVARARAGGWVLVDSGIVEEVKECHKGTENRMSPRQDQIDAQIRETPLLDRLARARDMICAMCSNLRPPRMSIPPQATDEDMFIICTLKDAIAEIEKEKNKK